MESKQNIEKDRIDQEKLNKLRYRIYNLEHNNSKTQKRKYGEMVKDIIQLITKEVDNDN